LIKLIEIKKNLHLSFVFRHQTKDITKNILLADALVQVNDLLKNDFCIANLFTSEADISWEVSAKGKERLLKKTATFQKVPARSHDKQKKRFVQDNHFLIELDILDAKKRIRKDKGNKFKQINKFIEIIDSLLTANLSKQKALDIIDMGAGKGYLTFALYDYLINNLKIQAKVKGVEIRPDLILKCNNIAKKVGFEGLSFEKGFISDYNIGQTDILIALHACDTATDDAIFKGIQANAQLIICAPCCHKQIRKEIKKSETAQAILDYGILKERQAEIITDAIRALLLELAGYKTKVFEFISTEHTGKNVMIVGEKHNRGVDQPKLLNKINQLKTAFGIEKHYLERLLSNEGTY
jgi:hypothetical protein